MSDLLTHSSTQTFKDCQRKYWLAYELGLRPDYSARPLRFGDNVHQGLDALCTGHSLDDACQLIYANYSELPTWCNTDEAVHDWDIECRTAIEMVSGWAWRWQTDPIEYIASEETFTLPLINPATGGTSRTFQVAGKIDAKGIRKNTGTAHIIERKTSSDDPSPESPYWRMLRLDAQVSMYFDASHRQGFNGEVLYDVLFKPTIGPLTIPILDDDGLKIVNDADGNRVLNKNGKPRQSADAAEGWKMVTRKQTPEEYGQRLRDDIAANPDRYYQRQEIPRLTADITEFRFEVWAIGQQIIANRNAEQWPRNTGTCRKYGSLCPYFDICTNSIDVSSYTPNGFVRLENLHPELGAAHDRSTDRTTVATEATTDTAAATVV